MEKKVCSMENSVIFMAPPARLVPQLIDELFAWMNRVQGEVHPLILASVFHYEFVFIHPFSDGNGVWQDYGTHVFCQNGSQFFNIFQLKVR